MDNTFNFNTKKSVQAINYFINKNGEGKISRIKAIKLLFFVDKYLIRNNGKMLTNDKYFAMRNGPVASKIKDFKKITKEGETCSTIDMQMSSYIFEFLDNSDVYAFKSKKESNLKVFSPNEKKILDIVWEKFGALSDDALIEKTHKHPEWKQYQELFAPDAKTKRENIFLEDFLEDVQEDQDLFLPLSQCEKEMVRSILREDASMHAFLA